MSNESQQPPDITELWPDNLKQALATVVSLITRHAGARDSAAWSELWSHFERLEQKLATEREKKIAESALGVTEQKLANENNRLREELAAKRFDVWNKAGQEIEKLRDILKACEPFAEAWGAEDLLDRIREALVKQ